jgi:hypothetical protein
MATDKKKEDPSKFGIGFKTKSPLKSPEDVAKQEEERLMKSMTVKGPIKAKLRSATEQVILPTIDNDKNRDIKDNSHQIQVKEKKDAIKTLIKEKLTDGK